MKTLFGLMIFVSVSLHAQLRADTGKQPVDVRGGITAPVPGSLLGFLSPDRFKMQQSVGFSYSTGGGYSGTTGMYTNTMNFRLADPLLLRFNIGMMRLNFSGPKNSPQFENSQMLHGAELIYRPNQHFQMQIGYSNTPYYSGYGMSSPGYFGNSNTSLFQDYGFTK